MMKTPNPPSACGPLPLLCVRTGLVLMLIACAAPCVAAEPQDLEPIFNGHDLTGWQVPDPNPFWTVTDGVLIGQNDPAMKGNVLYTKKAYKDFIFETEARWTGEIDSGIMLRHPELQLQIADAMISERLDGHAGLRVEGDELKAGCDREDPL